MDVSRTNIHVLWEETIPFWLERLRRYGVTEADIERSLSDTYQEFRTWKDGKLDTFAASQGFGSYKQMVCFHFA